MKSAIYSCERAIHNVALPVFVSNFDDTSLTVFQTFFKIKSNNKQSNRFIVVDFVHDYSNILSQNT